MGEDLKKLGYLVADGIKFGGEYVAYPGDPKLYHAQFVIRILYTEQSITSCFLTAQTRVSVATRKHLVLVSVQEKTIKKRHKKQNDREKNKVSNILTKNNFIRKLYSNERIIRYGSRSISISYFTASADADFLNPFMSMNLQRI